MIPLQARVRLPSGRPALVTGEEERDGRRVLRCALMGGPPGVEHAFEDEVVRLSWEEYVRLRAEARP